MPFCRPDKITVPPDRFRPADPTEVEEMVKSMKEVGQLHPILVSNDMTLTAGLHRLEACKKLDREVWYATEEEGRLILDNPLLRRMAEYQENFRRREFTPAERSKAITEIDRLMREIYGSRRTGPGVSEGWTQDDTAKKLGQRSHRAVSEAISVTNAIDAGVPGVAEAKTMSEAVTIVKKHIRLAAAEELARRQMAEAFDSEIQSPMEYFGDRLILGNCLDKMKELSGNICSLYVTDPPWGIDMDDAVEDRGSAGMKAVGCYDDSKDVLPLIKEVIKEMYRVAKPDCYAVMFCGVRHWNEIAAAFKDTGWAVYSKMLIWVKIRTYDNLNLNISRSHAPAIWPNSAYDAMVLARKGQPTIYQMGKPDVFLHPPVVSHERCHQAQKPIPLLEDIISRFFHPGTNPLLIDPFAGSGSTLVAARRVGLKNYFGYELDPKNRERALAYMVNAYMKEQEGYESKTTIDLEDFQ